MSLFRSGRVAISAACLLLPLALQAQFAGSKPVTSDVKKGFDAITVADAKKWLGYLAGPECEGRGTGQPGYQKAADYVAARFKEFGLKPIGDNGTYFQHLPFVRFRLDGNASALTVAGDSRRIIAAKNFSLDTRGADIDATVPVVFIRVKGNGSLPSPEAVKGKAVVIFADGPMGNRVRGELLRAEATYILTVVDRVGEPVWNASRGKLADFQPRPVRRAMGNLARSAAETLLEANGLEKDFAVKSVANDTMEVSQGSKELKIAVKAQKEDVGVPNVVGLLEGSDPTLKSEVVAVGSHLDHMGTDGVNTWWGADDDGSGSAAVIGVAKAFSVNPIKPKRSVLFMCFAAEEIGLVGSAFYAQNPIIPLDKTQALMQMDMVGRNSYGPQNGDPNRIDKEEENRDTMRLVGSKRISQELDDIIQDVNQFVGFRFKYDSEDVYTRSDHYNFARNGVPSAFQFCGFTPDYHQVTDTVDKINFDKLTNSAKLCYLTLMKIGNMDRPLKRNASGG